MESLIEAGGFLLWLLAGSSLGIGAAFLLIEFFGDIF